jgi:aspartate kinase
VQEGRETEGEQRELTGWFERSSYIESGNRVAVVCSARSGESKSTGTTNLLLRAALEALRPRAPDLSSSVSSLASPSPAVTPGVSSSERVNPLTSQIFQKSVSTTNTAVATSASRSGLSTPGSFRGASSSLAASLSSLRASDEGPQLFNATVDQIKDDHLRAARRVVRDEGILRELEDDLDYDCERLRSFLLAAQVDLRASPALSSLLTAFAIPQIIDEISTRSKDIIIGVGERLSCRIVVAVLRDRVSRWHWREHFTGKILL